MKNVFIVGGGGFIGHHLVRRLLADKIAERVVVFDNLSSGKLDNIPIGDVRVTFVRGDARDYTHLKAMMKGCEADLVFHLAANPDIAKAVTMPTIDFDNGSVLTRNVLEAMRENEVKRLIYFSGSGIYGDSRDTLVEDNISQLPISPYGAAKLAGEAMISAYAHMFGIVARAFRFANVVGAKQTHGVGFDFLRRLKDDRTKLRILGDGTQTKSYIHVTDILNAVMLVADRCIDEAVEVPDPYAVYNVSTHDALTVSEIAIMAMMACGIDPKMATFEYTGGDRGWKGDVPKVRMNCAKIHGLGWRCSHGSKDAVWLSLIAMHEEMKKRETPA